MTNNNNLQDKIAELTAKYEHEEHVKALFPNYKTLAILHGNKKRIVVQNADRNAFIDVLIKLPPTNTTQHIGSATKHEKTLNVPFRINIENPCAPSQWNNFEVHISYTSGDIDTEIELPIKEIDNFVALGTRGITDSEYHYFTGTSYERLRKMKVTAYSFKGEQINWYGGNKTLLNEDTIKDIIASLSTSNQESNINKNKTEA